MTEAQDKLRETQYNADVVAHIAAHKAKGETEAVEAHMESPKHKAIVEAAATIEVDAELLANAEIVDAPDGADKED